MAYIKQTWADRQVSRPLTFISRDNKDGTITLEPEPGTVTNEGTLITAERMNHIEEGIYNISSELENLQSSLYSVVEGEITLENVDNTSLRGSVDLGYPSGFNETNCVCIAIGITGTSSSSTYKDSYTYGFLNDTSSSYTSGAIRRKVSLVKAGVQLTVEYQKSPAPSTQKRKYRIVLMKIQ